MEVSGIEEIQTGCVGSHWRMRETEWEVDRGFLPSGDGKMMQAGGGERSVEIPRASLRQGPIPAGRQDLVGITNKFF